MAHTIAALVSVSPPMDRVSFRAASKVDPGFRCL